MSPKRLGTTTGLSIVVSNLQPSYKPGDTINGHVFLEVPNPVEAGDDTLSIQLVGSTSANITEWSDHTGESQSSSRSCFDLFFPDDTLKILHNGPLQLPRKVSGQADSQLELQDCEEDIGHSWPFSIAIPNQTSSTSGQNLDERRESGKETFRQYSFISMDQDGRVAAHPLPPSFNIYREESGPGVFLTGRIEYSLEARSLSGPTKAMVPIAIHNHPVPLDGSSNIELERSQRVVRYGKRLWRKPTELHFEIGTPSLYMLDQFVPLSFAIRAMWPSTHVTNNANRRWEPAITLKALSLAIESTTSAWGSRPGITSPGSQFSRASVRETRQFYKMILSKERDLEKIYIPFGLQKQPLDLGQMLSMQMQTGATNAGSRGEGNLASSQLPPSFQTFNIRRCYKVVWEVVLDVAGEGVKLEGKSDIAVL